LYLGTTRFTGKWGPPDKDNFGAQLWRSDDGLTWQIVTKDAFGSYHGRIAKLGIVGRRLCASTWNVEEAGDTSSNLYCSIWGEPSTWTKEFDGSAYGKNQFAITGMLDYGAYQYISTSAQGKEVPQLWRRMEGFNWEQVNTAPINSSAGVVNRSFFDLVPFNGSMFMSVATPRKEIYLGATIWRCTLCNGSDWVKATPADGFGDPENTQISQAVVGKNLYAVVGNGKKGNEIWQATPLKLPPGALTWKKITGGGWGDSSNFVDIWSAPVLVFKNVLHIGMFSNGTKGGGVWKLCPTAAVCK
jgi:hypothetical protein